MVLSSKSNDGFIFTHTDTDHFGGRVTLRGDRQSAQKDNKYEIQSQ